MKSRIVTVTGLLLALLATFAIGKNALGSTIQSLDGDGWRIATDPNSKGREAKWFVALREEAKPTKVPWIIQDAFPAYHGVAWYWRDFAAPTNPHADGRCLLRFWAVDYKADVWLNGVQVGGHEGRETQLSTNPVAERLLRNLLRYAASEAGQPVADLPADFEQQLKAIGY